MSDGAKASVLVTGAGGYVGGRLVETLSERGSVVSAIVRRPSSRLSVEQHACDLDQTDRGVLRAACEGVETIVHLAGENEVLAARQPDAALTRTLAATQHLVEGALRAGARRLVYLSSVNVYGERMVDGAILDEQLRPEPRSSYAISRLASEQLVSALASKGVDVVILRLTNSVGAPVAPGVDRWTLVANDLCRQAATRGSLRLRSSGLQSRDFVALGDVCEIIADAAQAVDAPLPPGTYNLGSGRSTTVRSLAEAVADAFERMTGARPPLRAPDPDGEAVPRPYRVDVDALGRHGLRSLTPVDHAVEETARFCLEHKEELSR